jgi:hypothetical protein
MNQFDTEEWWNVINVNMVMLSSKHLKIDLNVKKMNHKVVILWENDEKRDVRPVKLIITWKIDIVNILNFKLKSKFKQKKKLS